MAFAMRHVADNAPRGALCVMLNQMVVYSADTEGELFAYGKKLLKENPKRRYYFFYAGDPSVNGPAVIMGSTTDVPMAH